MRTKQKPWTPAEWAIIVDAHKNGIGGNALFHSGLIPDRSEINIRNSLNRYSRLARGLCSHCLQPVLKEPPKDPIPGTTLTCGACKAVTREYQHKRIRAGHCAACGKKRDADGTATLCSTCNTRHKTYLSSYLKLRQRVGKPHQKSAQYVFPWPGAMSRYAIAEACSGRKVFDLFGGAAKLSYLCHQKGAEIVGWNDIHPVIYQFMEQLRDRPDMLLVNIENLRDDLQVGLLTPQQIIKRYSTARDSGQRNSINPALLFWASRLVMGSALVKPVLREIRGNTFKVPTHNLRRILAPTSKALQGVPLHCMDFASALDRYGGKDVVIVADPPWPGESLFEYSIGDRHWDLIAALLRKKADFILTLQSSNKSRELIDEFCLGEKRQSRKTYVYKHMNIYGHELVISSFEMKAGVKPLCL